VSGRRARFDGNARPHHHFVRTKCGRIVDFEDGALDRMALPAEVAGIGRPTARKLEVFGVYRACVKRKEEEND